MSNFLCAFFSIVFLRVQILFRVALELEQTRKAFKISSAEPDIGSNASPSVPIAFNNPNRLRHSLEGASTGKRSPRVSVGSPGTPPREVRSSGSSVSSMGTRSRMSGIMSPGSVGSYDCGSVARSTAESRADVTSLDACIAIKRFLM